MNEISTVLPPEGAAVDEDAPWQPLHPEQLADLLSDVDAPWYVAAGWALDLHRGEQTRPHHDLEIGVPRAAFPRIAAALPQYAFHAVEQGRVLPPTEAALAETFQTWAWDPDGSVYRVDVFRERHDGDVWVCRRDERVRLPYADIVRHTAAGLPYLAPELALLFKAKACRPKDQADFTGVLPLLTAAERARLRDLLDLVHPGHEWLAALTAAGRTAG
ncbi:hypothetical protein Cs7R123_21900 [Catellatospora sp. TT07R-123]|uniref:nucleotidyltransferase domain-containing protein n=1 Tax=Catellatospora sp. TT07R-123 TaxID=2733863 RepID=UPI001B1AB7E1|nr:hypothetical protein [Catellatospora sp. TT07R-123]GHJ44848.1 hypothetical protein Cs7R123_21900 [Catellatospora sp. TT07R-123]